jgi:hypothetical protein
VREACGSGETTNGAIAHHLMSADLKAVHAKLANTIASPLTAVEAARMAESIRAVFNTNAQAIRFLPDPVPGGPAPFSIRRWVQEEPVPGSILFITSTHTDLTLNRALLTLWMDLAVNALMGMPRTRDLRMWYLLTRSTRSTGCRRSSMACRPPAALAGPSCWGCTASTSSLKPMARKARSIWPRWPAPS